MTEAKGENLNDLKTVEKSCQGSVSGGTTKRRSESSHEGTP